MVAVVSSSIHIAIYGGLVNFVFNKSFEDELDLMFTFKCNILELNYF